MCSAPKPKRKIKVNAANNSAGILSAMSLEKRSVFALIANQASECRFKQQQAKIDLCKLVIKAKADKANTSKPWHYWLSLASFFKIIRQLLKV